MRGHRALGAMEPGRSEVLCPVHGHQQITVDGAIRLELTAGRQGIDHRGKDRQHGAGRDRIEQIADLIVARDLAEPKQAQRVVAPLGHLQGALEIQERGAWPPDRIAMCNCYIMPGISCFDVVPYGPASRVTIGAARTSATKRPPLLLNGGTVSARGHSDGVGFSLTRILGGYRSAVGLHRCPLRATKRPLTGAN
jgi:hypothetical protein